LYVIRPGLRPSGSNKREKNEKMKKKYMLMVVLQVLVSMTFSESKDKLIERVISVTGIEKQYSDMSKMIEEYYKQQKGNIESRTYEKILGIIYESFSSTNITNYIKKEMENNFNEKYCKRIIKRYKNELFLSIANSEVDYLNRIDFNKVNTYNYQNISSERDSLFDRFIDHANYIGMQKRMAYAYYHSYITTYNLFLSERNKVTRESERIFMEEVYRELESKRNRDLVKKQLAIIYEKYSEKEIEYYLKYILSSEGKWLNEKVIRGFEKGYNECMKYAVLKIGELLKTNA
jgi:hypothetical protein